MARVVLTQEARDDLLDLDRDTQRKVVKKLRELETEPEKRGQPLGHKAGIDLHGLRKIVVGNRDYRIVYQVSPNGDVVVIWVIAARADNQCYELAKSRLELHPDRDIAELATHLLTEIWKKVTRRK